MSQVGTRDNQFGPWNAVAASMQNLPLVGVGSFFGGLSLARREGKTWLALAGLILNALLALLHLAIVLFAG